MHRSPRAYPRGRKAACKEGARDPGDRCGDDSGTACSHAHSARPDLERFADLVTHPSPKEAKDLYRRLDSLWPRMCEAVAAIDVGGTRSVSQERSRTKARQRNVRTRRQSVSAFSRRELRTTISGALRSLSAGRVDLAAEALRTLERRMV